MRVVVAGAGETGVAVAGRFSEAGHDVVLLDCSQAALTAAEDALDVMMLQGDITHRRSLRSCESHRADAYVAVTGTDSDNMVSAGLAKQFGAKVSIARVDDPRFYESTENAEHSVLGIDAILCATRLATSELLSLLLAVEMRFVQSFATHGLRAALVPIGSASPWLHRAPASVELSDDVGLHAVVRDGFLRPVQSVAKLESDDQLLIAGDSHAFLDAWVRLFPQVREQRMLIVGGGDIGVLLASALSQRIGRLQLVEVDRARAEAVAEELRDVTVLTGDARKSDFLRDLQISSVDHLITATADDEINLLVSLLGRRLGARNVLTLLRQPGHAELFREVGVAGTAGAFDVLARVIEDVAVSSGPVREVPIVGTGYTLLEWRLPPAPGTRRAPPTVSDVPTLPTAMLVGRCSNAVSQAVVANAKLQAGETLLFVVPKRELSAQVKRLGRFNGDMEP